ncbi:MULTISPECIES: NUDIX hydrolase [unclassified Nocardiopsis]|uniref:NUDIX hydrolase n=1 Tax=unclassified Nocardiopsis TaxID=2649073 RepID=UPI001F5B080E|nr:NUDIX domain-containing protein [Nocardiopsis sp. TSRI0078]
MSNSTGDKPSTPLHSVSVAGAVIREDGRMLVIKRRDNGNWEPPGGVLELDETPQEGVVREVLEETGVHVEVDQLTGVYKNMARGIVALVFRCTPSGGTEFPTSESVAVEWITPEEAPKRMHEVYAIRLLDALEKEAPCVRSHNGARLASEN